MSTGGGSSNATTTQQSAPWGPVQPYLMNLLPQAQSTYQNAQGQTGYPDTVAPFSPQTQDALNAAWQRASAGSPVVNAAEQNLVPLMQPQSGPDLSPAAVNPYLDQMFQAESQPVTDAVNAQFGLAGRTGSGAQQQELTRDLGNLAGQVYGNNYLGEQQLGLNAYQAQTAQQQLQLSAMGLAPGLANQDYTDLQNMLNVGGAYDSYNQNVLNNQLAQWQYAQQQPWNILNAYGATLTGLGSLGGTSSGSNNGNSSQWGVSLF